MKFSPSILGVFPLYLETTLTSQVDMESDWWSEWLTLATQEDGYEVAAMDQQPIIDVRVDTKRWERKV